MLAKGLSDALSGAKLSMSKQEISDTLIAFQKQMIAKQQATFNALSTKNLQEGTAYMAANKTKPDVVTTASGLQYKILTPGDGPTPGDNDVVTVDYTGSFINGKVFDSSIQRGKPVTFPVSEVIPGWTEALKLMKQGATYEIVVPPNLAYGARGLGNVIGPNQTLLFKIHLISVKPAS
jgi:FKBP-type peptidyl-prolyl cis-trans isomerase FklB